MSQIVQSIQRAMAILVLLGDHPDGLQVREIASLSNLNKSTVSRILFTLATQGFVEQNADKSYRIGLRILDLGSSHFNSLQLKTEAVPHLELLRNKTSRVIHLGVMQDNHIVYLDKVSEFPNMRMYSMIGKRAYCHATGLGKAMMSQMDRVEVAAILSTVGMPARTENTLRTPEELYEELDRAAKQGYALDNEENETSVNCVAAPIFDYTGTCIAAVSATGFGKKPGAKELATIAANVQEAALHISQSMGYKSRES